MSLAATESELRHYRDEGYFVRERVFAEAELERFRDAVERIHCAMVEAASAASPAEIERIDDRRYQQLLGSTVKWEWREGAAEIRSMEPYHHLDADLDALIDDPRLWRPSAAIVGGERVSLFSDKLNFKRPGGAPFPWHQDTPYWAFECGHLDRLVSLQLYLDDATRENGCLWVIPHSHLRGALPCYQDRGVVGRLYTDIERFEGEAPVPVELPAGSAIWFHGDLVHGSQGNRSAASRRALVLTYQPADLPRWRREDVRPVSAASAPSEGASVS